MRKQMRKIQSSEETMEKHEKKQEIRVVFFGLWLPFCALWFPYCGLLMPFFWFGCPLLLLLVLRCSFFLRFMLNSFCFLCPTFFAFCIPLFVAFCIPLFSHFLHFLKNVLHLFCICSGCVLLLCLSLFSYLFPYFIHFLDSQAVATNFIIRLFKLQLP